ncbi:MAG: hypothetical protein M1823_000193 [Watsoniomyces obsoletus]|nr:MAG: hypothetical protein M1823_000193 [Watsoniomyces obsoletus]
MTMDLPPTSALKFKTLSLLGLLTDFEKSLDSSPSAATTAPIPDVLNTIEQSTSLIKAETTKLSLLCNAEPFTSSEVNTVLEALFTEALPVLMGAVENCSPTTWGLTFTNELRSRTRKLLKDLEPLLKDVSFQELRLNAELWDVISRRRGSNDRLYGSAGVIWEACDELMELKKMGIAGVVAMKAQEYQDMVEDAITELKEWGDEDEEKDDEGKQDALEDDVNIFLQPHKSLSKNETELKSLLAKTLKQLEFIKMLYKPLIKRRLKTFPSPEKKEVADDDDDDDHDVERIKKLEWLMKKLKRIQDQTDELASAFYEHNIEQARELLGDCVRLAKESASVLKLNWKDEMDELSPWLDNWKQVIDK